MIIKCILCKNPFEQKGTSRYCGKHKSTTKLKKAKTKYLQNKKDPHWHILHILKSGKYNPKYILSSWLL